jgi:hypothetical protein
MKLKGQIALKGIVTICHYRNGRLLSEERIYNTKTTVGIDQVSGLIGGLRASAFDTLRLGTSGTQATSADTDLLALISAGSLAPAAATVTQITTDTTNDTAYWVKSWSATASYTVKEAAIATSASGGRILSRTTFDAKALTDGDSLTIYWQIDVD